MLIIWNLNYIYGNQYSLKITDKLNLIDLE